MQHYFNIIKEEEIPPLQLYGAIDCRMHLNFQDVKINKI